MPDKIPKTDFVHLHVHSHYSLLDGLARPAQLAKKAKELGMKAIALTDHGVMFGALEFWKACRAEGVKPIIGCEFYIAPGPRTRRDVELDRHQGHVILLARNNVGYRNLLALTTKAHTEGFYYKPRIDHELMRQHADGLIALTACLKGEIPGALLWKDEKNAKKIADVYREIYGAENFFLEMMHHPSLPRQDELNAKLVAFGKKYKIPLVATNDVHYVEKDENIAQDVLMMIQMQTTIEDEKRLSMTSCDLSLRTPEQMRTDFAEYPEALENTIKIAERCNVEIETGKLLLPNFPSENGKSSRELLWERCFAGLADRYGISVKIRAKK